MSQGSELTGPESDWLSTVFDVGGILGMFVHCSNSCLKTVPNFRVWISDSHYVMLLEYSEGRSTTWQQSFMS